MPLYEFECHTCGQTFDKVLPLNGDASEVRCPSGHRSIRRLYSAVPVVFKGSGFYVTDHRSSPASPGDGKKA